MACLATVDVGMAISERMDIDYVLRAGSEAAMVDLGEERSRNLCRGRRLAKLQARPEGDGSGDIGTCLASDLDVTVERFCSAPGPATRRRMRQAACPGSVDPYLFSTGSRLRKRTSPCSCPTSGFAARCWCRSNDASPPSAGRRDLRRDEAGASAVEFAIVGSILIAMLLAVLQLGWALQIRSEMARAADQAVRQVMLDPDTDDEEFEAEVAKALSGYEPSGSSLKPDGRPSAPAISAPSPSITTCRSPSRAFPPASSRSAFPAARR
jgi:Flp pilus assembly pilin Flp